MIFWFSAWIAKAKQLKGSQRVVGEDGGPAEEEDRHDQDQHVDHLDHHDDGDRDEDDEQVLSKNMILYIQSRENVYPLRILLISWKWEWEIVRFELLRERAR